MTNLSIRSVTANDVSAIEALWEEAGMTSYALSGDIAGEITGKLERDPDLFLLGEIDGTVLNSLVNSKVFRKIKIYDYQVKIYTEGISKGMDH